MNDGNQNNETSQKGKHRLLIGILIGLLVLLTLSLVVLATPLKEVFIKSKTTPEISLVLVEEQLQEDGSYRFEVETLLAGSPLPEVIFSRDDSDGAAGENRVWILLEPGEQYTLTAEAKSSAGSATAQIELEAEGDPLESPDQDDPAGSKESPDQGGATGTKESPDQSGTTGSKGSTTPPGSSADKNSLPIITAIKFNSDKFAAGETYKATAEAGDPDGDPLTYKWSGDGTLSGAKGNSVNWTAPNTAGTYKITVKVEDGRGGAATLSKAVTVTATLPPPPPPPQVKSTTLTLKYNESGWIEKDTYVYGPANAIYIGDNHLNTLSRGLVSFDLSELKGKEVIKAVLKLANPSIFGSPSVLGELRVGTAYWGARAIEMGDYKLTGTVLGAFTSYNITLTSKPGDAIIVRNLAEELQKNIDAGRDRFQIRLQFSKETNYNAKKDGVDYSLSNISLTVDYY